MWGWEVRDRLDEFRCGLHYRIINHKPQEPDSGYCKLEYLQIEYDPLAGTFGEDPADRLIVDSDIQIKQERVISAFPVIGEVVTNNPIHP